MLASLENNVVISFKTWLDNLLTNQGQGYINTGAQFYYFQDNVYPANYTTFSCPFKQLISDNNVSGAFIPTGIYANGSGISFDNNTWMDWDNGRVISTVLGPNDFVSGNFAYKQFNTYLSNLNENKIIFENRYLFNNYYTLPASGIPPYQMALPACFILNASADPSPWSLGSSDFQRESFVLRTIVITNNQFNLDAVIGLIKSQNNKNFTLINSYYEPYDQYGKLKPQYSGGYNYNDIVSLFTSKRILFIKKITSNKIFLRPANETPLAWSVSFINTEIEYLRTPGGFIG